MKEENMSNPSHRGKYLTRHACEQWLADGLGIDDIAAETGRNRDVVKQKLKEWGLWPK